MEGLEAPTAVKNAIDEYREESDIINEFIKECLVANESIKTPFKHIYTQYDKWCNEYGYRVLNKKNLSAELRKKGMTINNATDNKVCLFGYGIVYNYKQL